MSNYKMPRGYAMDVPFPPGSGNVKLTLHGQAIKEFPYTISDEAVQAYAVQHKGRGL